MASRDIWLAPLALRKEPLKDKAGRDIVPDEEVELRKRLDAALNQRRAELGSPMPKSVFVKALLAQGLARVEAQGWAPVAGDQPVDNERFLAIARAVSSGILTAEEASRKLRPALDAAAKPMPPVRASKRPATARKKDAAG